jgi:heavy metal sensor kinase
LRLRLQAWHALILLVVVVGFGSVLYREIVRSRWDEVDAELLAAGRVLEGALRALPRPILDSLAQDLGQPRRPPPPPRPPRRDPPHDPPDHSLDHSADERARDDRGPRDGNGRPRPGEEHPVPRLFAPGQGHLEWDGPPGRPVSPDQADWEHMLSLPRSLPEQLGHGDGPAYFIIWRRDGSVLRQANVPYDDTHRPPLREIAHERRHLGNRERGPLREVFIRGPEATLICVGRSVRGEQRRLAGLGLQFAVAGAVILAGGLLGGWWLSRSAIAPIERMSRTAGKISAANLSERMDLSGVDLELEQLGSVLNTMLARLDTAFTAQQRFTADASHELRTPLAVMLSTLELALSKSRTPEEYREHLIKCQRAAMRMHGLIDSLLTLARTDDQSRGAAMQQVPLHQIVEENVDGLRPLARERQVELKVACQPTEVNGNATQLGQVVANLVQNAILYNHPGGRVDVQLRSGEAAVGKEHTAELTVVDTGQGIPAADLPHIFERFYRVDAARSRAQGGSGLGLAICQHIVALHGGAIAVTSEPGSGSTFVVKLPTYL